MMDRELLLKVKRSAEELMCEIGKEEKISVVRDDVGEVRKTTKTKEMEGYLDG
jgi:hypothetical protein